VAPISIRPWSGLIDFERFTVFHISTSGGGHDCLQTIKTEVFQSLLIIPATQWICQGESSILLEPMMRDAGSGPDNILEFHGDGPKKGL
jgi:hypothetical protein